MAGKLRLMVPRRWRAKLIVLERVHPDHARQRVGESRTLANAVAVVAALCLSLPGTAAAVQFAPGDILVADSNAFGGSGAVIRVNPASGAQTTVSSGGSFVQPAGVALEADGDILVADQNAFGGSGDVIRIDPTSGAQTTVSSGGSLVDPVGIALEADGDILVADVNAFGGSGGVIRIDPANGAQTTVSSGGSFVDPIAVALDADGDILVADIDASSNSGSVIRVDPASGAQTTVSSGGSFVSPRGVALEADGDILVPDFGAFSSAGGVIRVDPVSGAQTTVSSGGSFVNPNGVALESDGDILVVDIDAVDAGAVIRVDPASGAQTTVSSGGSFLDPTAIAVVPTPPNQPPDCSAVSASPDLVEPATRDQLRLVTLSGASDPDGDTLAFRIDGVAQDEPVSGAGIGDTTSPDAQLTPAGADSNQVLVRAERNPKGNGRVYRIAFTVSDGNGGSCDGSLATTTAKVAVPRRKGVPAVDDFATGRFDSFTGAALP